MAEIIEHMGDVENMPKWMQEAFRTGRVYHTCVRRVRKLEGALEKIAGLDPGLWQTMQRIAREILEELCDE
jgi:hypothetical protein